MKKLVKRLIPNALIKKLNTGKIKRNLTCIDTTVSAVGVIDSHWRERIDDVISSPDNDNIPRVEHAGELDGYKITMHNGVKVCANGYYGAGILNMLIENKGVHEPQEEKAFEEIVRLLPDQCVMLELGAYWGFYSLSLLKQRPEATCFLVEPEIENLMSGKINFDLNRKNGYFTQALVDKHPRDDPKTISVDSFCKENNIQHLHILHSDIQGFELSMLDGATNFLKKGKVDYIFISTHSDSLHTNCIKKLTSLGYIILADADINETFSYDGLIVAKHYSVENPKSIEISKKV